MNECYFNLTAVAVLLLEA